MTLPGFKRLNLAERRPLGRPGPGSRTAAGASVSNPWKTDRSVSREWNALLVLFCALNFQSTNIWQFFWEGFDRDAVLPCTRSARAACAAEMCDAAITRAPEALSMVQPQTNQ